MTEGFVLGLAQDALLLAVLVAGPFLIASLVVGVVISLLQAATQVTEMTLTFVPKLIASGAIIAFLGAWMLRQLTTFAVALFSALPDLAR